MSYKFWIWYMCSLNTQYIHFCISVNILIGNLKRVMPVFLQPEILSHNTSLLSLSHPMAVYASPLHLHYKHYRNQNVYLLHYD